jgi:hypothetical protein
LAWAWPPQFGCWRSWPWRPLPASICGPRWHRSEPHSAWCSALLSKERSERRRKTLEAYEKQFLDKTLREAIHSLRLAVAEGRYAETTAAAPESHLGLTTLLLNYLETCCADARHGLYDRDLLREFLGPLAQFMVENFLVAPCRGRLPTEVFLPLGTGSSGVAPEEAAAPFPNLRRFFPEMIAAAQARDSDYAPAPSLR